MDAERNVGRVERYVKEAKEAWLADKDEPDKASLLKSICREEREKLDSIQNKQVAGGEDLRGCKDRPAWRRAAEGGAPGGRHCPGSCHQGLGRAQS